MLLSLKQSFGALIRTLHDPFSQAFFPLVDGLLRKLLLHQGAQVQEHCIRGVGINLYVQPRQPHVSHDLPILLIHGIADNALTWAFVMRSLSTLGTVYAVDLPGFGLSGYPPGQRYTSLKQMQHVLEGLLADVVRRPVLLVGNSLGGWLAVHLAWAVPQMLRGVVLLNAGGAPLAGRYSWQPFIDTAHMPDLRTVRHIYRQIFGRMPLPLYLGQRSFQAMFWRDAVHLSLPAFASDDFLQPNDLRRMPVPAGLIWGTSDTFLPAGSMEFFIRNLWCAPILRLAKCGHLPQREQPWEVVRFVRRFARCNATTAPPVPVDALSPER